MPGVEAGRVERTHDRQSLRVFLEQDRGWGAYALGDLEPDHFERTDWYLTADALCMVYRGLNPPPLFFMGELDGVGAILDVVEVSPAFLNVRPEHLAAVAAHYRYEKLLTMWRMLLTRRGFRPVGGPVARLKQTDVHELQQLYTRAFGGDAFAAFQLRDGVYYGIFQDGHLVSAAGTHVVGLLSGVAAVGNVATLPEYRNRGYARGVTSAVCAELFGLGLETIVLNVNQANGAALHAYRRLGFEAHCEFLEGPAAWTGHRISPAEKP